jgi:hypothetical protein
MLKIVATFIGFNSLGYENGTSYRLFVKHNTVCRIDGTGVCKYESVQSFLNNWSIIQ